MSLQKTHPIIYIIILLIILFPSIIIFEIISNINLNKIYPYQQGNTVNSIIFLIVTTTASFSIIALYKKLIDKESFYSMGLTFKNRLFDFVFGLSLGTILMLIGFLLTVILGAVEITSINFNSLAIFKYAIMFALVSVHEEVLIRGFLLNNLTKATNKYVAIAISSIVFAILHLYNSGITIIAFVNIMLAGTLLSSAYVHTKNLWFPIGLHFTWNFTQGPILGFDVSGQNIQSIIEQKTTGSVLITGGNFGFEASILATIILLLSTILVEWFFRKKEKLTQKLSIKMSGNELYLSEDKH